MSPGAQHCPDLAAFNLEATRPVRITTCLLDARQRRCHTPQCGAESGFKPRTVPPDCAPSHLYCCFLSRWGQTPCRRRRAYAHQQPPFPVCTRRREHCSNTGKNGLGAEGAGRAGRERARRWAGGSGDAGLAGMGSPQLPGRQAGKVEFIAGPITWPVNDDTSAPRFPPRIKTPGEEWAPRERGRGSLRRSLSPRLAPLLLMLLEKISSVISIPPKAPRHAHP